MVRELANHAASSDQALSPESLSGIGDTCALLQTLAYGTRMALTPEALNRRVKLSDA